MKAMLVGVISFLAVMITAVPVEAESVSRVVISNVQAGGVGAASHELIGLFNNTDAAVDITGWCLTNKHSFTADFKPLVCMGTELNERVILPEGAYAVMVSATYLAAYPETETIRYDGVFGDGVVITGSKDIIGLYDGVQRLIDQISWTSELEGGKAWQRMNDPQDPLRLLDSGSSDSLADFLKTSIPTVPLSGVEYDKIILDVCGNMDDIQEAMPSGYGYDDAGNCEQLSNDVCANLEFIQMQVPAPYLVGDDGGCYLDVCQSLDQLQATVPAGYRLVNGDCEKLEDRAVLISEVLPNVSGVDTGNEFLELYNPHDAIINLEGYVLLVGKNLETSVTFNDIAIPPYGYAVFSDTDLGVTLLNTSNSLRLVAPAGNIVSETSYQIPKDDESWALIDSVWHYTDQLTPGSTNSLSPVIEPVDAVALSVDLPPCGAGKYRNPITNRCRNIESDTRMLVACDADEYRNPETNRCKKTSVLAASLTPCREGFERSPETNRCRSVRGATASLVPCKPGSVRNPATNRCRSTAVASAVLKPCQQGYERNPGTNRCRKTVSSQQLSGASETSTTASPPASLSVGNMVMATVGVGALSYGIYEWRQELGGIFRRLLRGLARR